MSKATRTLLAAALFGALAAPALAQDASAQDGNANAMASTQSPPSAGLSNEGPVQSLNSLPASATTALRVRPGSDVETTQTAPTGAAGFARGAADKPAG